MLLDSVWIWPQIGIFSSSLIDPEWNAIGYFLHDGEAVAHRCFAKQVFLKILQNAQENTSARFSFLIKLQAWGQQLY